MCAKRRATQEASFLTVVPKDSVLMNCERSNVETVHRKERLGPTQIAFADLHSDLPFFAGQQGKIIIGPESGQDFMSIFFIQEPQANEEGQAGAGILDGGAGRRVLTGIRDFQGTVQSRLGQILQSSEVRVVRQRRVVPR